jgi:hypothetical protein
MTPDLHKTCSESHVVNLSIRFSPHPLPRSPGFRTDQASLHNSSNHSLPHHNKSTCSTPVTGWSIRNPFIAYQFSTPCEFEGFRSAVTYTPFLQGYDTASLVTRCPTSQDYCRLHRDLAPCLRTMKFSAPGYALIS